MKEARKSSGKRLNKKQRAVLDLLAKRGRDDDSLASALVSRAEGEISLEEAKVIVGKWREEKGI